MAGKKILSIEVGYSLTKVVLMDAKETRSKVLQCFQFETPVDMLADGVVKPSETFRGLLNAECGNRGISVKNVVFTIASNAIASRIVEIPLVKEKKIPEILAAGMADYFPVDMSMYHTAWKVLETTAAENNAKKLRVNITVVPNELVASYKALAKMCGLTLIALDYIGNSVYQVSKDKMSKGATAVLKVDERSSMVTILRDGKLELQRNLAYGIDDAVAAVMNDPDSETNRKYKDALDLIRHKTCIRQHLNPDDRSMDDESEEYMKIRESATEGLRSLVMSVSRALNYYESQNKDSAISQICLIGAGADFSGLARLMTNELGQKVTALRSLDAMKETGAFLDEGTSVSAYAACIGAGMFPLDILGAETALAVSGGNQTAGKGAAAAGKELSFLPAFIVCGVCIVAAGAMLAYGMISSVGLETEKLSLQSKIQAAQDAQSTYDEYEATEKRYQNYEKMYSYTENPNGQLKDFIDELERKMPSDINVLSFSADTSGVVMTINTGSKESAALILEQLRTFSSLGSVVTAGTTEATEQGAANTVNLSVTCTYAQAATDSTASGTTSGTASETTQSTSSAATSSGT